jgi:sulfide:quinone oxidoreductase
MRVVVAGGGIAALEVLAGLRALAGDRVAATLVAPVSTFSFRPLSTAVPFTFRGERTRTLSELADGLRARFVHDGLAQVDESRSRILTHKGDLISYDAIVVAVGARVRRGSPGTRTWTRGPEGRSLFSGLLRDLESGAVRSAAFVVPRESAWPVDGYELALVASLATTRRDAAVKLRLVTAEDAPLDAFGPAVGEAVAGELTRAGIELITRRDARGSVGVDADRALFLPEVHGPAVAGLPHDSRGFIPVDAHARTRDGERSFAAGDATALSLKHSAISASQATAAAEAIAAEAGADVTPTPWSSVLHGLLTVPPHFPAERGSPWLSDGEPMTHCLWWPPGHVAGRFLAPYLAASDHGVRPGLGWHPHGIPVAVEVSAGADGASAVPLAVASADAIRRDALTRQLLAIRRAQRDGERLQHELERRGSEFERHERETVEQLEAAGYLRHTPASGR